MTGITTEVDGRRIYIKGNTYPIKDQIKALGGKWDDGRKAWWIGAAKGAALDALLAPEGPPREDPDNVIVSGKARYKGRSYYVRGATTREGRSRLRLTSLDCSVDFWATLGTGDDEASWERTYESARTLGSIRRFMEQQKNPATRRGQCSECGAWGPAGDNCDKCYEGSYV